MHTDRYHEHGLALAREAAIAARAPRLCYDHGVRLGRIIEISAAACEVEFVGLMPASLLELAESIQEGFWHELELPIDLIDYGEVERGMCAGSQRYAEARAVEAHHAR